MEFIKKFIKTRGIGFYLTMSAVLLSIIQLIIYSISFSTIDFVKYKHFTVLLFGSLAVVSGILLSGWKYSEKFAPLATFVFEVLSFVMFIKYGYMYFTELFFAGFSMEAVSQMYYGYMGSIVLYVLIFGLTIASQFIRQSRKIETNETKEIKYEN